MDKNSIKKYAVWARRELISRVSQKALQYGVSENEIIDVNADTINGHLLTSNEKKQRQALINRIKQIGYQQTMEEAAYTWFNRFSALRYMEVNGFLPTHVRVFTDEQNAFKPQILAEAIHLELDGLNMEKVYELKDQNKTDELYKYLLITQCNALSTILPGMFTRIADYTELLFPDNLLREGSVIEQMISMIPEDDWKDVVQIIGWLYQYYNAEPKDKVFENLKKNIKISKENIPAATQLFTPDWIVRYMVENSLGRLWVEGHPNDELKANWKYYLEEVEQEPEVQAQLVEIRKEYAALKPEEIKVIDPCMGSGHILVYMFDVLVQIYESYGYNAREAAGLILQTNLYGLDIDDRAAQLAYFAVMMKARQYDRRIFSRGIQPHVYAIVESNGITGDILTYFENGDADLKKAMESIVHELQDAKEYGSILNLTQVDFAALYARLDEIKEDISIFAAAAQSELLPIINVANALSQKYHTVVTNPPYMGSSGMSSKLSEYVKKFYPDSKSDLFAVFIEKCSDMAKKNGYQAMITQHAWMFLSSFEKLRNKLLYCDTINMSHLGARAFEEIGGEVVQTTSFVLRKSFSKKYKGLYCRLTEPTTQNAKEEMFLSGENRHATNQADFHKIPGSPIAYWVSKNTFDIFENSEKLKTIIDARIGMVSGDNDRFLRLWPEVIFGDIEYNAKPHHDPQNKKWYPLQKAGSTRYWYGANDYVINWENDGYELKNDNFMGTRVRSHNYNGTQQFKEGITWNSISTTNFCCRYVSEGFTFDAAGPLCEVTKPDMLYYVLAMLSSKVANYLFALINPTINFPSGYLESLPLVVHQKEIVTELAKENIELSKSDWDSFETSWDFKRHPLVVAQTDLAFGQFAEARQEKIASQLSECFREWESQCLRRFYQLKENEEELNRIFIDIYGLQDELTPEVDEKNVTVRKADLGRDIRSLISYAVGCMFGRYSLDCEGLAYAGGEWDASKYATFPADKDNIIPICDDDYFDDDITGRFIKWVETVYGATSLESNLKFIADALGGKGTPRDVIRSYFLNDFYADHLKIYQKRPIYWLFDSGKKNGFKALIYMHRYQPDTIARMRTDYVHEQQSRYRTAIADLEQRVNSASTGERVKLSKKLQALQDQTNEIRTYEEKIHHLADMMIPIDLNDGVKVNYAKFEDVLAKIK